MDGVRDEAVRASTIWTVNVSDRRASERERERRDVKCGRHMFFLQLGTTERLRFVSVQLWKDIKLRS